MAFVEEVHKHKFSILRAAALVLAIIIVGSATIDVYVETTRQQALLTGGPPTDVTLVLNRTGDERPGVGVVTVEKASANLTWGSLKMVVNGTELAYDTNASRSGSFCVSNGEASCTPSDVYAGSLVNAGDEVHVHHADLTGRTLRVADRASNAIIASVPFTEQA